MPQAVQVVTFDGAEKEAMQTASTAAKASTVGKAVSDLIKSNLSALRDAARSPQADPETLARAKDGLAETIMLIDSLPGNVGDDFRAELVAVQDVVSQSLALINR